LEAFDPDADGASESEWRRVLDAAAVWQPDTPELLVVAPHPDDETLGAGGLMRQWREAGARVVVASVTDGEAAYPDWTGLASIRRRELAAALFLLCGTQVRIERLGVADGRVAQHRDLLRSTLGEFLHPGITIVAPYECDGHPDHEAVGSVCRELAETHELPIVRYPIWAWHHRSPRELSDARWVRFPLSGPTRVRKAMAAACFLSQRMAPGPALGFEGGARPADRRTPVLPDHVMQYFSRPYEAFLR
jgi:LmbE family N-acetylglucosaminyl deacetylase